MWRLVEFNNSNRLHAYLDTVFITQKYSRDSHILPQMNRKKSNYFSKIMSFIDSGSTVREIMSTSDSLLLPVLCGRYFIT